VFQVIPKMNTAGRFGDANRTVELLITSDDRRAKELISVLTKDNEKRTTIQNKMADDATQKVNVEVNSEKDKAIILFDKKWHPGILGVVASKLKEEYNRSVIVISNGDEGLCIGSGRSIRSFDMVAALKYSGKYLMKFGGHPMAAGFAMKEKKCKRIQNDVFTLCTRKNSGNRSCSKNSNRG